MILFNEQDILEQIDNSRLLREDGESNLLSYSNDQGTFKSKPTFVDKAMELVFLKVFQSEQVNLVLS